MQIHLKQWAIEEALHDYITKKGINLQGCQVEITFTSGRRSNGLSADIHITENIVEIPGFSDEEEANALPEVAETPRLKAVNGTSLETQETKGETDEEQEAPSTTSSLFN